MKRTNSFRFDKMGRRSLLAYMIGFVLVASVTKADWSDEILIWEETDDLPASHQAVVIAVDSLEQAHVVYSRPFRNSEPPNTLRIGLWYRQYDNLGNQLVEDFLISDSLDLGSYLPTIRLFGTDSLMVIWKSYNVISGSSFKYTMMQLDGTVLQYHRIFLQNHHPSAVDYCFETTPDRRIVFADGSSPIEDTIFVTVQLPDGERVLNEAPVWRTHACDRIMGYVDHTDSLQLIWRQYDGGSRVYGKRVGIVFPPDTSQLDQYSQLTEINHGPLGVKFGSDSTIILIYSGQLTDLRYARWIDVLNRDDYSTISSALVGLLDYSNVVINEQQQLAGLATDTVSFGGDTLYYWTRSLPELIALERDSVTALQSGDEGYLYPMSIGISRTGIRHIVYAYQSPDSFKYIYRFWRSDLPVNSRTLQNTESYEYRIWPNPTNGKIFIGGPLYLLESITIFNILGQKYSTKLIGDISGQRSEPFNIAAMPSGYYYFQLKTRNSVHTIPLLVIR